MAGRVRQPIDERAFTAYLSSHVPEIKTPIELKQFGFGQSNPTYQITAADGQRFVMRKKPPGKLLSKTAHKVEREYRIMHALEKTDVPVPRTYCLCEDESVIGTPFYIMEFLDGRIIEDFTLPGVAPEVRREMWRQAVLTLAKLHAVDFREVGLESFGKGSGFYNRQIKTWITICASQSKAVDVETKEPVGQLPHFDETVAFFRDEKWQPRDRATLVHGDFKIDNLVFHKTEPRVIGILDWEMSTVGHPLSDICNFLTNFFTAKHAGATPNDTSGFLPGRTPGLPQPDDILAWYSEEAGYNPSPDMGWGMAFNIWRLAAVCQGIAARYAVRQASSEKAKNYVVTQKPLARCAWSLAKEWQIYKFNPLTLIATHRDGLAREISQPPCAAMSTRRRIQLVQPDERQPLLTRRDSDRVEGAEGGSDPLYSCRTDPHSHLPVYTNIHRIRRDIISVVEDYLSLAQLTDVRINVTVVRPLVDKFYELDDISIVYCLLVNRAQFLEEQASLTNRQNVNWTRATLCELIATRILRRFNEDYEGSEGLILLSHILVAGFEPFQNAPPQIREEASRNTSWSQRTLPSLEVAILTESKHFLSSTTCQKIVTAIYEGRIIYTPSTFWDIIPDHYKQKPISLYDPRESPLLNQYRLIVPRTRSFLESIQFTILLTLYVCIMIMKRKDEVTFLEVCFAVYAFGWGLDQFATILAHGWNVYTQNLWSFLDVAFILIYSIYMVLRLRGQSTGDLGTAEQAFDVLALGAPVVIPRLAFTLLSDNLIFLSLRSMMADFFALTALSAWCFFGFLLSLLWLGENAHSITKISSWMIYIWFGLDGVGIERSSEFHRFLGPSLMIAFAFLGNTLFLTILVSMLSNTFSNISSNAVAEMQFRRAVLTLEGVKADAVFAYQPPFNILAVFLFLPLKFVVSPRWFHKIHVATVKFINLPVLLLIAVYERRLLWSSHRGNGRTQKSFWQRWHLSASTNLRGVFQIPPPEDIFEDIAVDDELTRHLIRRQFMRQTSSANESRKAPQTPSRRDSMFPGIRKRLRGSFAETEEFDGVSARLDSMEKSMMRLEGLVFRLLEREGTAVAENEGLEGSSDNSMLNGESAGFTAEPSFYGATQSGDVSD
ncbi:unnamed protein product [Clonostachys rosea]|uniref:Aminoglycoside phosphotransferase domain-containing protein n=1 Tax=Bionectria ochroleuca TaxID=29856 RepID=A0ABY6TMK4_BIOOC|nr:unnamed protein product [Clonostachys rosea]